MSGLVLAEAAYVNGTVKEYGERLESLTLEELQELKAFIRGYKAGTENALKVIRGE